MAADIAPSSPTPAASDTAAASSAFAGATASDANLAYLSQFNNMSSGEFDAAAYNLSDAQTGCYRKGALPVALATGDTCLQGWYCKSHTMMLIRRSRIAEKPEVLSSERVSCASLL